MGIIVILLIKKIGNIFAYKIGYGNILCCTLLSISKNNIFVSNYVDLLEMKVI